ncbi:alanine dehydrogenase [Salinibacter ruber]|uniref:alanine dehydrogenase n=1 Tax=Salinibacter ruber TaxID=146919 RepID=UPI002167AD83|nr:alanine dehydrogenase [Salinibacter ruber]MCS3650880.1 alanine dehydrogenase [Salinibacter ruber]MCS3654134.1 alanine dehydrogenase [Salinibacter ruber]
MEIPSLQQGFERERGLMTQEKPLKQDDEQESLRIGVPREVGNEEQRVALAPSGTGALVANGHEVYVKEGAGHEAHFQNDEYVDAGAELVSAPDDLYERSDLIVKVGPPVEDEMELLQKGQILLSALNLGGTTAEFLHHLMRLQITGIGFEFIRDPDGTFPLVRMMHEITGSVSIQIAGRYLESNEGGKGVMLGGISGVPPATVVILGADVIGQWAARTALGYGAHVIVLDTELGSLRTLENTLDRSVTTAVASEHYLRRAVRSADVVVGAMVTGGERSPLLVTEDMVQSMAPGGVIVDAVMDQGGCIETSRPTTHSDPTYRRHDIVHYCVPNMPSNAARTASYALTHVLVPYLLRIGEAGSINEALWRDEGLRNGTYVYRQHLTKQNLASMFGMSHRDIELLIASGI